MISETINRQLFYTFLKQDMPMATWATAQSSYAFKCEVLKEPVSIMADEFLNIFDDETVQKVLRNVSQALTVSKHLLMYEKEDLIWFQHSLARMKNARGAFRNKHHRNEGEIVG